MDFNASNWAKEEVRIINSKLAQSSNTWGQEGMFSGETEADKEIASAHTIIIMKKAANIYNILMSGKDLPESSYPDFKNSNIYKHIMHGSKSIPAMR